MTWRSLLPQPVGLPAQLALLAWTLAMLALLRAIEWPPPDLRLLRLWRLAGRRRPLTTGVWCRQQLLCCGTARWWLYWQAQRRERRLRRELPALVDRLCIALGCGLDWPAALELAALTSAGGDICSLLRRRALLTPTPVAALARELRHEGDALACLLRWSHRQGIAAYDLRHDASSSPHRLDQPGPVRLRRQRAAYHPGHP